MRPSLHEPNPGPPPGLAVYATALADRQGLHSTPGVGRSWAALGVDPNVGPVRWPAGLGAADRDWRRLDATSRMFALAAISCDRAGRLDPATRRDTALVLATATGCLATDLRFAAGLHDATASEPALFPYTLPSTCLGEIAIRLALKGPTIALSCEPADYGVSVTTAVDLLLAGEARAALVLCGDWCPPTGQTRIGALLLQPVRPDTPATPATPANPATPAPGSWQTALADPFAFLAQFTTRPTEPDPRTPWSH